MYGYDEFGKPRKRTQAIREPAKPICIGCGNRASGHKTVCVRPAPGHGCTGCLRLGIVCIFEGTALPRHPGPVKTPKRSHCDHCKANGLGCDFKRPCDVCYSIGIYCSGDRRNCFDRGIPSDDMYGYYLTHGYGPGGVFDPPVIPPGSWRMPNDYHLQYIRLQQGEVPDWMENIDTEQAFLFQFNNLLNMLKSANPVNVPMDKPRITEALRADWEQGYNDSNSQAARDLTWYVGRQSQVYPKSNNPETLEVPIETHGFQIPHEDLVRLNPGSQPYYGNIAPIRYVTRIPKGRPSSPRPARPLYWIPWNTNNADIQIIDNSHIYAEAHPERVHINRLIRNPLPEHPCEDGESPLASIPFWRIWTDGESLPTARGCEAENALGGACGRMTVYACEDKTHYGAGTAICLECDQASKGRYMELFRPLIMRMRRYLCSDCTSGVFPLFATLKNSGYTVFYNNDHHADLPDFATDSIISTGLTERVGEWRGPPLELTGCSCGLKLFGRRICTPHRLQYLINTDRAVTRMRDYVMNIYGRMVCPLCRKNPGIDDYGFEGEKGGESSYKVWTCLNCHAWVVTGAITNEIPANILNAQRCPPEAPPPYNTRPSEMQSAAITLDWERRYYAETGRSIR